MVEHTADGALFVHAVLVADDRPCAKFAGLVQEELTEREGEGIWASLRTELLPASSPLRLEISLVLNLGRSTTLL